MKLFLPLYEVEMRRELRDAVFKIGIKDAGKKLLPMGTEGPCRVSYNRFLLTT